MRRFRLKTLMTMIVIAALCICLAVQHERAARREAASRPGWLCRGLST